MTAITGLDIRSGPHQAYCWMMRICSASFDTTAMAQLRRRCGLRTVGATGYCSATRSDVQGAAKRDSLGMNSGVPKSIVSKSFGITDAWIVVSQDRLFFFPWKWVTLGPNAATLLWSHGNLRRRLRCILTDLTLTNGGIQVPIHKTAQFLVDTFIKI